MEQGIPVTQARADFAELVNRVVYGNERIVVTRHGRPLVALVSAADLDRLNELDRVDELDRLRELADDAADMTDATGSGRVVRLTGSRSVAAPPPPLSPSPRYDIAARHEPPGRANPRGTRH
jgi:prevent-host-death family protein